MSQYSSRIHIKVNSPEIWNRFEEYDEDFELYKLAETEETSFCIDGEWSCEEDELYSIVEELADVLGKDGIVIADTTNINVDPYDYCVLYFGDKIHHHEFDIYDKKNKYEMFFETSIENISGWLNYGGFKISEKEKEVLFRHGISYVDGYYTELAKDISLPSRIYLRETSFDNRPSIIEKTFVGADVYLVHAKDEYDPMRIEVMNDLGSLGYLPSDVSDKITPSLVNNRLSYNAKIVELVRLSERNKHAKSPIVAINIELKDIMK